ncbi:MAG: hypothetical protein AAB541_02655 [Patescibacteria group bacterium]
MHRNLDPTSVGIHEPIADELELGETKIKLTSPRQDLAGLIELAKQKQMDQLYRWGREHVDSIQTPHTIYWTLGEGRIDPWEGRATEIKERDELLSRIRGRIVLDLGCGIRWLEFEEFLKKYEPSAYVGVDIWAPYGYRPYNEIPDLGIVTPLGDQEGDVLPGALIKGDMLEAISRMPDKSCCIALNGVDAFILPPSPYRRELEKEMVRVVSDEGIIFGVTLAGGLLSSLAKREGFQDTYVPVSAVRPEEERGFNFITRKKAPESQTSDS